MAAENSSYTHIVWTAGKGGEHALDTMRRVSQALGSSTQFEARSYWETPNGGLISIYTTEENARRLKSQGYNIDLATDVDRD